MEWIPVIIIVAVTLVLVLGGGAWASKVFFRKSGPKDPTKA